MEQKYDFSDISIKWAEFQFRVLFLISSINFTLSKKGNLVASIYLRIPRKDQAEAMRGLARGESFVFGECEHIRLLGGRIEYDAGVRTTYNQYLGLTCEVIDELKQVLKDRFDKPKIKLPDELETAIKAFGCHEDKVRDLVLKLRGEG